MTGIKLTFKRLDAIKEASGKYRQASLISLQDAKIQATQFPRKVPETPRAKFLTLVSPSQQPHLQISLIKPYLVKVVDYCFINRFFNGEGTIGILTSLCVPSKAIMPSGETVPLPTRFRMPV